MSGTRRELGRRLIISKPEPDRSREVLREFVVACGDAAEVIEFAEEAFDEVASAVKSFAEAGFPLAHRFGGDVGHGALRFVQVTDAVSIICFASQHDGSSRELVE